MNIKTAIKTCLDEVISTRAISTAIAYEVGLKAFSRILALDQDSDLSTITIDTFIAVAPALLQNGYSKKTVGVYISAIEYFTRWMVINGYLSPTYAESLRITQSFKNARAKRESKLPRFPKKDDVDKMVDAVKVIDCESPLKERNVALIYFLRSTGCRNNEARSLTVGEIDLLERRAIVTGKGSKQRVVFFDALTASALVEYWNARGFNNNASPAFARHDRGSKKVVRTAFITTASVRNIISDVSVMAGIEKGKFTPHYFRHAFAIKMLRETGNLALVQDILGHASPVATRVYAKIYPDEMRDAYRTVFD